MKRWSAFVLLGLLAACTTAPPKPTTSCVDFHSYKAGQSIKDKLWLERFTFDAHEAPLEFRDAGAMGGPVGTIGLQIKDHVYVGIDEPFTLFEITYISNSAQPIRFETYDQDATILDRLYKVIESRKGADPARSGTARLFAKGTEKIAQKLGEEAVDTVIEGVRGKKKELAAESADLLYHLLVLWADRNLKPAEVWATLAQRSGVSGIEEKKNRKE